ncbi:MAG: diaminopimelate epimerase [Candidatus Diapherotrites archaeon]|nr:diaminopimelate epimerase [Candidatus Diapherotrites archaeon]
MKINFSKIHGLGNDFIVIDEEEKEIVNAKAEFSRKYCERHRGIGADGVLFMQKSKKADFLMRIFNADGSEAENCINGIRCITLFKMLKDIERGINKDEYLVESKAGLNKLKVVKKNKNKVMFELSFLGKAEVIEKNNIKIFGEDIEYIFVDVGNPHAVFFIKSSIENFEVEKFGHLIEYHERFKPKRTNAEFVNVLNKNKALIRIHERGACETMACGSGSIAVYLAGLKEGIFSDKEFVEIQQPGGSLYIKKESNIILLRGEAEKVFDGILEI